MALRIYSNPLSVVAQNKLTINQSNLGTSIERLSSGLRINHAADDASGMAVSEKISAQIRGYQVASRNTQDGISYLQTAEGGLESISSMLQRMRELAVQAANGIYTTTDRVELQKEVDQLKQEITRITNTTEFNTKKLLNGDGTALWSANSKSVSAVISGAVNAGNYKISTTNEPGQNYVYNSHIMALRDGAYSADIRNLDKDRFSSNSTMNLAMAGTNSAQIGTMNYPTGSAFYTVSVLGDKAAKSAAMFVSASASLMGGVHHGQTDSQLNVSAISVAASSDRTGFTEFRVSKIQPPQNKRPTHVDVSGYTSISGAISDGWDIEIEFRFHDAKTGDSNQGWRPAKIANVKSGSFSISAKSSVVNTSFKVSFTSATSQNFKLRTNDSWVLAMQGKIATSNVTHGGGVVALSDGVTGHSVQASLRVGYSLGELTQGDNNDGRDDFHVATLYTGHFDASTGVFGFGGFDLHFKERPITAQGSGYAATITGKASLFVNGAGQNATRTTRLVDISKFINSDGKNMFSTDQNIAIYANGGKQDIVLEPNDTLNDVNVKFSEAMTKLGLGARRELVGPNDPVGTMNKINNNLAYFVSDSYEMPDSSRSMPGTFVLQSALIGENGRISVVGEEGVVSAFSFNAAQTGRNSRMHVEVRNSETNQLVGTDIVENNKLEGVLKGVRLDIDSTAGLVSKWNSSTSSMNYSSTNAISSFNLHLVNNASKLQTGPNEAQTLDVSIPQLNTRSLDISDAYVFDRQLAEVAITKFDLALRKVGAVRATIGAQSNRLTYTGQNLDTMRQNLVSSKSRITDTDIASETAELQKNQVLQQASQAMVSQANRLTQSALSLLQGQ